MQVTRLADAKEYHPPLHHGCTALRLQGFDASAADFAWTGLSHILPGGGADMDAGPLGKIYVVTAGAVTVSLSVSIWISLPSSLMFKVDRRRIVPPSATPQSVVE